MCRETYGGQDHEDADHCESLELVPTTKISARIIDRALKPIHGMFFGLPKNRAFRRACDDLSRDLALRNCGPAFILRKAMETMPAKILDQDFVKTEDLAEGDIQVHNAPRNN